MALLSIQIQDQTTGETAERLPCLLYLFLLQRWRENWFAAIGFGALGGREGWGSGGRLLCIVLRCRVSKGCIERLVADGIAAGLAAAVVAAAGNEGQRVAAAVVAVGIVAVVAVVAAAVAAAAFAAAVVVVAADTAPVVGAVGLAVGILVVDLMC